MTYFPYMIAQCGLSPSEAAIFLEKPEKLIHAWIENRTDVPDDVIKLLASLYDQIHDLANDTAETLLNELTPYWEVDIAEEFYGFSDLPCAGARNACIALTIMLSTIPPEYTPETDKK